MLPYYIRLGVTMCFLIFLTMALLEPRFTKKKTLRLTAAFTGALVAANVVLMGFVGYDRFTRLMPLTVTIPYLFLYFYLCKFRDWRPFFSLLTVCSFGLASIAISGVISNIFLGQSVLADLFVRLIFFLLIGAFVLYVFRRPYLDMLTLLKHGWILLCIFPLLYYAAVYFIAIYPDILHNRPDSYMPIVCVTAMLFSIYSIIVLFFHYVRNTVSVQEDKLLVEAQAAALRDQLDFIHQYEGLAETRSHDLLQRIEGAVSLLRNGKNDEALTLLTTIRQSEGQSLNIRYCENETMNALLTVYIKKAEQEGIDVTHQLYIPKDLPVDAAELSTVFANALGNAIRLCGDAEPAKRLLEITFLFDLPKTQTAFEIACPFHEQFELTAESGEKRPVVPNGPLTVGFRGVEAFAQRHDALYSCKINEGRFYLRMVVNGEVNR